MGSNGSATYKSYLKPKEKVVLPSGMGGDPGSPVILRYPTWRFHDAIKALPSFLARKVSGNEVEEAPAEPPTREQMESVEAYVNFLLVDVFVTPRLSLTPHEDEIDPADLADEDRTWVVRWATEKMKAGGGPIGLETFRPESRPAEDVSRSQ